MMRVVRRCLLLVLAGAALQFLAAQTLPPPLSKPAQQSTRAPRPQQDGQPGLEQEKRIALVIGNGAYQDAPLKNPVNDARSMALVLQTCGFQVIALENASLKTMREGLRTFGGRIAQGGVGLVYFAGHGMQVKGRNYLMPVGADIQAEDEIAGAALDVDSVLAKLETARNRLNIVILDACRNDPFTRSFRSASQGLAPLDAPVGTFIAFATAPGKTAADGSGNHGLYTEQLLTAIQTPGLKLEDTFKRVLGGVRRASSNQQVPWTSSSVEGDFFFNPSMVASLAPVAGPPAAPPLAPPALASTIPEPEKQLKKNEDESPDEFRQRISMLPSFLMGTAVPQKGSYDQENRRLAIKVNVDSWAAHYLPEGTLYVEMEPGQAMAVCDEGGSLGLEGRFAAKNDGAYCSALEVVGHDRRYVLGDTSLIKRDKGFQIAVSTESSIPNGKGPTLYTMGYLVESPLAKAYKSRYVHMPESALFKPVNEQIAVAKELGISMLVMVKVGFAFSKIMYYDVKHGNQMTDIHVWAIDNPLVVATARQCEDKLAHDIEM